MPKVANPPILPVEERQRLVLQHRRLAWKEGAAQWHRDGMTGLLEDYVSSANLGLCLAARSFDPSKGWKFITYATAAIRKNFIREHNLKMSQCRRPEHDGSGRVLVGSQLEMGKEDNDNAWWAGAAEPEPESWSLDWLEELRRQRILSQRQLRVLKELFIKERQLTEVGKKLKLTKERVRQIREQALEAIRTEGRALVLAHTSRDPV